MREDEPCEQSMFLGPSNPTTQHARFIHVHIYSNLWLNTPQETLVFIFWLQFELAETSYLLLMKFSVK